LPGIAEVLSLRARVVKSFQDCQQNFDQLAAAATLSGKGSPEGVVTAAVGALYTDEAGGIGSTLYVKESGGGTNVGWAVK
jgi:hypothetical protein